jgi:hypothetical protein
MMCVWHCYRIVLPRLMRLTGFLDASNRGEELVTVAEILGHTDIRTTKRYSHGMQKRSARLWKSSYLSHHVNMTPRRENRKTAGCAPCRKYLILWWSRGGPTPDLCIANGPNGPLHLLTCADMQRHNLQFFNRLQPTQVQFLVQCLSSIFIDSQRVESRIGDIFSYLASLFPQERVSLRCAKTSAPVPSHRAQTQLPSD